MPGAPLQPALVVVFPTCSAVRMPPAELELRRDALKGLGVDDPKISGRHARIARRGPRFFVEDLGSRNGTWIDGIRIAEGERVGLDDGALVRVGRTLMVLREHVAEAAPGSWPDDLATTSGLDEVRRDVEAVVARPPPSVLVTGETGTGKEALSRLLAARLRRARWMS